MRELPWHLAYLGVIVAGNVVLALVGETWPLSAQIAFAAVVVALFSSVLLLGRERPRHDRRARR